MFVGAKLDPSLEFDLSPNLERRLPKRIPGGGNLYEACMLNSFPRLVSCGKLRTKAQALQVAEFL